jgi:hypothetical protein
VHGEGSLGDVSIVADFSASFTGTAVSPAPSPSGLPEPVCWYAYINIQEPVSLNTLSRAVMGSPVDKQLFSDVSDATIIIKCLRYL